MSCCSGGSGNSGFSGHTGQPCPTSCTHTQVSCNDILSVAVQAILNINSVGGSTVNDIYSQVLQICDDQSITIDDVSIALMVGAQRGIFFRKIIDTTTEPTFMINSNMVGVNPRNAKYMRWPCQNNNFFHPVG